jgi:hypothetical protein
MLPKDLTFTVFVLSPRTFHRVIGLQQGHNASTAAEGDSDDHNYTVLSRVLGFSTVPRLVLAVDALPCGATRLALDSVSGLRIHTYRDARRRGSLWTPCLD